MNQTLELLNKDFKAAITKVLQPGITNALEISGRKQKKQNRVITARNKSYLKNGNSKTERYNNRLKS